MDLKIKTTKSYLTNRTRGRVETECVDCGKQFSASYGNNKSDLICHITVYDMDKPRQDRMIYQDRDDYCEECAEHRLDSEEIREVIQQYKMQETAENL